MAATTKRDMTAEDSLPELQLFGATALSSPVTGGHIACNPVIDLTATVGEANTTLHVWRAGDQLVSKHEERGKRVEGVRWKEDGNFVSFFSPFPAPCFCIGL
jgi:anaphase-promoting complex subunit 4